MGKTAPIVYPYTQFIVGLSALEIETCDLSQ